MTTLDETDIPGLLEAFYARVRADALLGPVFNGAVDDWDEHLERIGAFWSSVMFASGRYKGNPVARHMPHAIHMTPDLLARWLAIWDATTSERLGEDAASALQVKAHRIAESLKFAIDFAQSAGRRSAPV